MTASGVNSLILLFTQYMTTKLITASLIPDIFQRRVLFSRARRMAQSFLRFPFTKTPGTVPSIWPKALLGSFDLRLLHQCKRFTDAPDGMPPCLALHEVIYRYLKDVHTFPPQQFWRIVRQTPIVEAYVSKALGVHGPSICQVLQESVDPNLDHERPKAVHRC